MKTTAPPVRAIGSQDPAARARCADLTQDEIEELMLSSDLKVLRGLLANPSVDRETRIWIKLLHQIRPSETKTARAASANH